MVAVVPVQMVQVQPVAVQPLAIQPVVAVGLAQLNGLRGLILSDLKRDFDLFAYGTPLIDCGSQFCRIRRRNHQQLLNMSQEMASGY